MESIFINAGLVAGATLAAVPVILHLFMKQTPKHVVFPALRLIRERQKRSRKRLRIKNWLLLLARMALIALMALALARPRLWSKTSLGDQEVPTALALVFDTSLSMGYREKDKTRLEEAKERALELLKRTHEASRIYVIDSSESVPPTPLSPALARKRIDALSLHAVNRPLNEGVGLAYKAVADAEQPRHEVCILTDLARSAWDMSRPVDELALATKKKSGISTYVIRLAPKVLSNVSIVEAEPASLFLSAEEKVPIRVRVQSIGPATQRVAELLIDGKRRDQKEVRLVADGEAVVTFESPELSPGLHQGEVHIGGEPDPLEIDDHRYFTLDVQPRLKVLIVSDRNIDAAFVADALMAGEPPPFRVDRMLTSQLESSDIIARLREYACIFLLNVRNLPPADWGRLNQYVMEGGGLVVALGDRVTIDALNEGVPTQILPGTFGTVKDPSEPMFTFGKAAVGHPLFEFNPQDLMADLASVPIDKYCAVTPLPQGTRTLLSYQNGDPRTSGAGLSRSGRRSGLALDDGAVATTGKHRTGASGGME